MTTPDAPPLVTSVEISLYDLLDLLFHTRAHNSPLSRVPTDPYCPVIISKQLEARLAVLPAALEIFHIESYSNHAELWYRREWMDSASRLSKRRAETAEAITLGIKRTEAESKQTQAHSLIFKACRDKFRMPVPNAQALATNVVTSFNLPGFDWMPLLETLQCEEVKQLLKQ